MQIVQNTKPFILVDKNLRAHYHESLVKSCAWVKVFSEVIVIKNDQAVLV